MNDRYEKPHHLTTEELVMVHDYNLHPSRRELWLHGVYGDNDEEPGVDYRMATKFIKNLRLLQDINDSPITIHMQTCGGIVEDGLAIYDSLKACPCEITIINYTHARSMSSIILQAADHRIMHPHSCFMFHMGTVGVEGDARTSYSIVDFIKNYDTYLLDIYIECCRSGKKFEGKSDKAIKNYLVRCMEKQGDVFLTASEAIEWGFADKVYDGN